MVTTARGHQASELDVDGKSIFHRNLQCRNAQGIAPASSPSDERASLSPEPKQSGSRRNRPTLLPDGTPPARGRLSLTQRAGTPTQMRGGRGRSGESRGTGEGRGGGVAAGHLFLERARRKILLSLWVTRCLSPLLGSVPAAQDSSHRPHADGWAQPPSKELHSQTPSPPERGLAWGEAQQ